MSRKAGAAMARCYLASKLAAGLRVVCPACGNAVQMVDIEFATPAGEPAGFRLEPFLGYQHAEWCNGWNVLPAREVLLEGRL